MRAALPLAALLATASGRVVVPASAVGPPAAPNTTASAAPANASSSYDSRPPRPPPHKDLFPMSSRDYLGLGLAVFALVVAAGGGIGGGGMLVPIYILALGFDTKTAIPLSNITILGGAITNTWMNSKKRHPRADRPLVDWDLVLIMEPSTILGALVGSFLNKMLPEMLLIVLLVALLAAMGRKTLLKGAKRWDKETLAMRAAQQEQHRAATKQDLAVVRVNGAAQNGGHPYRPVPQRGAFALARSAQRPHLTVSEIQLLARIKHHHATPPPPPPPAPRPQVAAANRHVLDEILARERHVPTGKVQAMCACFVGVLALDILKETAACGTRRFWLYVFAAFPFIIGFQLLCRRVLVRANRTKEACGYEFGEGDIRWTPSATLKYPAVCTLAGLFAGMFGVGGGIVKGPLMLEMGVEPAVSAATAACMILFTSSTAALTFWLFGSLNASYAGPLFAVGLVATYLGQTCLNRLLAHSSRSSPIVLAIGLAVALSAVAMGLQGAHRIATAADPEGLWETAGPCDEI